MQNNEFNNSGTASGTSSSHEFNKSVFGGISPDTLPKKVSSIDVASKISPDSTKAASTEDKLDVSHEQFRIGREPLTPPTAMQHVSDMPDNTILDQDIQEQKKSLEITETNVANTTCNPEGVLFLTESAEAITEYISRILKSNETIPGRTGDVYTNKKLASSIIMYLDIERSINPSEIFITNNLYHIQDSVFLLEAIKLQLLKGGKSDEWNATFSEIKASLVI